MTSTIQLGDVAIDVVHKDVKNIHLSVHPPEGNVRISAPAHLTLERLHVFAISKLGWIKREQRALRAQARETPREYVDRESHFVWGCRYLLAVRVRDEAPAVTLHHSELRLGVRPGTDAEKRQAILSKWYRDQLKGAFPSLVAKWEKRLGVKVSKVFVQRMKTKWGSCNPEQANIRLNTELAKKRPECLEYILVHEMSHLLEPTHSDRFRRLLDRHMPNWRSWRDELNRAPLGHEAWPSEGVAAK